MGKKKKTTKFEVKWLGEGGERVRVIRCGVEYRLIDELGEHPVGQLFIGYENSGGNVELVRWIPGVFIVEGMLPLRKPDPQNGMWCA